MTNLKMFRRELQPLIEPEFKKEYPDGTFDEPNYINGDYDGDMADLLSELTWSHGVNTPNGKVEEVERFGGEGQGDEYWYVFKFTPNNSESPLYFRIDGYYSSWDGHNFDYANFYQVTPQQKVITEYK